MRRRCNNPRDADYESYGGRGISVCERWKNDFWAFVEDMGERPGGCSLDRVNNDGNYSPENCRWATPLEQSNNTRSAILVTYEGKTQSISAWAREKGLSIQTLAGRLRKGWSIEKAFTFKRGG